MRRSRRPDGVNGHQLADRQGEDRMRARERQRLAMQLHDGVAQALFAIGAESRRALATTDAAAREHALRSISDLAGSARADLYATLARLNHMPRSVSLHALFDGEVRAFAQATGIQAAFLTSGDPQPLVELQEGLLIDTLVEALRNVRKHAITPAGRPAAVVVRLGYDDDAVHLVVCDDGGAPASALKADSRRPRGALKLLAERAEQLRGVLELELDAVDGAIVSVHLPLFNRSAAG